MNLIHVEDLARLCLQALRQGQAGTSYNISDGQPRRWVEICHEVSVRWGGESSPDTGRGGRQTNRNHKALTQLQYTLRHPDFYQALRSIEGLPA